MSRCISLPLPCAEKTTVTPVHAPAITFQIFTSAAQVDFNLWNSVLPENHLLLNRSYLTALEASAGSEIGYRYLIIQRNNIPVGIGFFQVLTFKGSNVLIPAPGADATFLTKFTVRLKTLLAKLISGIEANLLVSGNTFITGEYGFYFTPEFKNTANVLDTILKGIDEITAASNRKIAGFLVKDFYRNENTWATGLKENGYLEFYVNPNMLLDIRPHWKTPGDYYGDMASKYRTRMKKAQKRAASIVIREMNLAELEQRMPEMDALYNEVVDKADFKLVKLDCAHFVKMKREMGENFIVLGFYKEDTLLTFISYFQHENTLVAGYMGIKHALNQEYDLYLNVLLKLAETAIEKNISRVVYGRTAMEIKSSVGAIPHPMSLYLKHRSPVINFLIKRFVPYFSVTPQWTQRTPFKEQEPTEKK